jgi:hypothetical protein
MPAAVEPTGGRPEPTLDQLAAAAQLRKWHRRWGLEDVHAERLEAALLAGRRVEIRVAPADDECGPGGVDSRHLSASWWWCLRRLVSLAVGVLALTPLDSVAQQRAGPEFVVNSYTTGTQYAPRVASQPDGAFMVVWNGAGIGDSFGVFARIYDASGAPLGVELLVNTYTTGWQGGPVTAAVANGEFVVVWQGVGPDGSATSGVDVFGRRVSNSAVLLGTEFRVNTFTSGAQARVRIAGSPAGYVVTWDSHVQDGDDPPWGVFGQCYTPAGFAVGGEFRVNTFTTQYQWRSSLAMNGSGQFVVVWSDHPRRRTFGQRYASDCTPVGAEFQAHSGILGSVGIDAAGNFVVAGLYPDYWDYGVSVQRFAADGAPVGYQFLVNQYTTHYQDVPEIAVAPAGDFVVMWHTYNRTIQQVLETASGRAFRPDGTPATAEFHMSTYVMPSRVSPTVGLDANNRFVVVWTSPLDGNGSGVSAQRFLSADVIFADGFDTAEMAPAATARHD